MNVDKIHDERFKSSAYGPHVEFHAWEQNAVLPGTEDPCQVANQIQVAWSLELLLTNGRPQKTGKDVF